MIPNVAAFFWHADTMSWMRYWTLRSFRICNPGTEMLIYKPLAKCRSRFHTDTPTDTYNLYDVAKELDAEIVSWKCPFSNMLPYHASDFAEWEFLSTIGGWYLDMDILFVKPIPTFASNNDAVFCFAAESSVFTIGFLGAASRSPIYEDILTAARRCYRPRLHECTGALSVYAASRVDYRRPFPAQQSLNYFRQKYPDLSIMVLPDKMMYAFRCESMFDQVVLLPQEMIGLHWFGGHPISQSWNNLLNEDNWQQYENSFTLAMQEVRKL